MATPIYNSAIDDMARGPIGFGSDALKPMRG